MTTKLATPLQSVRILPIPSVILWGQSVISDTGLSTVNTAAAVDTTAYAARDMELAYRDVVLTSILAKISARSAEIFGIDATRPAVQGVSEGTIDNIVSDMASTVSSPGAVTHVSSASVPVNALATDCQLYSRDLVLHEALVQIAQIFDDPQVSVLTPCAVDDTWSLAEGVDQRSAVNAAIPFSVGLFKCPDQELSGRDNKIAAAIANVSYELNDLYGRSSKLLVQVNDAGGVREPDVYVLLSDDGRYRSFVTSPGLDLRNRIVYDRMLKTVAWFGETYAGAGSTSFAGRMALNLPSAQLQVIGDILQYRDSQFWRQKSSELRLNSYKTILVYAHDVVSDISSVGQAIHQPDSVLLPSSGTSVTLVPQIISPVPAIYRLAVYFEPSRVARLYGSFNVNGVVPDDGYSATLVGPGFLNWSLKLVSGTYTVSFQFADMTMTDESFSAIVTWNGLVLFNGTMLYREDIGSFVSSNLMNIVSDGSVGSFTIQRTDSGPGSMTIRTVDFSNVSDDNLRCTMTATMGGSSSVATFSSQSNRSDTLWFDFYNVTPNLVTFSASNVAIGGLYVKSYDIRRFGVQRETVNTSGHRQWKRTCVSKALDSVKRSYLKSTNQVYSTSTVWNMTSTEAWINSIEVYEPRIREAFRIGLPGDVGQPSLTPSGIYYDVGNSEVRVLDESSVEPTSQVFQPWMIEAGIYVFNEDFWVEDVAFSTEITECGLLTTDFSFLTT